ncbi:stalk domain-containing protein [Vallitalea guaymasensis]|uniref:stalk domain-containing protein n=1 Tax=Vallitalea guaymasensis TaxID=1185412 RepID=UPI000DE302B2|nr:stalk domain-containing protein [Vallitalea guaymasensis]
MKIFKKFIVIVIALSMLTIIANAESLKKSIDVYYNIAKKIVIDGVDRTPEEKKPFVYEGTTYVPLRYISESLGKEVKWDGKTGTIYIGTKPDEIVYLTDIEPYNINDFDSLYSSSQYKVDEEMTMGNKKYMKGLQLKSSGYSFKKVFYNLDGQYKSITGLVGLDDSNNEFNFDKPFLVNFYLDDNKIKTLKFNDGDLPKELDLNIEGGLKLIIEVGCESNNHPYVNFINMEIN